MSSAFNLLTAGGARFDKQRFGADHQLFAKASRKMRDKSAHGPQTSGPCSPPDSGLCSRTRLTLQKQSTSSRTKAKGKSKAVVSPLASTAALPSSLNVFHDPSHASSSKRAAAKSDSDTDDEYDAESDAGSGSGAAAAVPAPPKQKITLTGPDPLPSSLGHPLSSLATHPSHPLPTRASAPLLQALDNAGIASLWGVQCAVGGSLLSGADVLCVAPTGSGKTLAYVLPTLVMLQDPARSARRHDAKEAGGGVRAVVLVPTHDLAVQIDGVVRAVTRGRRWRTIVLSRSTERAVCESAPGSAGPAARAAVVDQDEEGESEAEDDEEDEDDDGDEESTGEDGDAPTTSSLAIDILIATPERLHHLLSTKRLSLKNTRHLVLDESDRLLSPDFLPQVAPVVRACKGAQKCFLSATMPAGSEEIARGWMRDPVRVVVGLKDSAVTTVSQSLLYTSSEPGKLLALRNLFTAGELPYPSLIFVQSIERADDLYRQLATELDVGVGVGAVRVGVVHGGKSHKQRDETVQAFREGRVWVLVVTEVMARGMDFGGVKVVVNYDFPQTVQSYVHRIGRTGRAGRAGRAITFFGNEDAPYLRTIANVLKQSNCAVPQWMLDLPKPSKNTKRHLAKAPVKRKRVGGGGRDLAREARRRKGDMIRGSLKRRKGEEGEEGEQASKGE